MSDVRIPVEIPFAFNSKVSGITIPATLPITFKISSSGITIPATLPITFKASHERVSVKIPTKITCEYANERKSIKLLTKEISSLTTVKIPVKEMSWSFQGLVLEETVVDKMNKGLTLIEDVRSRILVDAELIDRNNVSMSWYGDRVPQVEIYKKMLIDEEWTKVSTHNWNEGYALVELDNNEYEIKILGSNSTGESAINTIGESMFLNVDTLINVSLNEKVFAFDIDLKEKYRIEVNL